LKLASLFLPSEMLWDRPKPILILTWGRPKEALIYERLFAIAVRQSRGQHLIRWTDFDKRIDQNAMGWR
jgi:hypothetical protein